MKILVRVNSLLLLSVIFATGLMFWTVSGSTTVSGSERNEVVKVFALTPDKTLVQIRDEIRAWRKESADRAALPVRVEVSEGRWFVSEPVVFEPEDSNISFVGQFGKTLFTRGKKIDGWKVNNRGWFETQIPAVANGQWWFDQLYVNDHRAVRAKSPNEFYHYIQKAVEFVVDPVTKKEILSVRRAFIPRASELPYFESLAKRNSTANPIEDVTIRFFHSWSSSKHRIQSYDPKQKVVLLTGNAPWGLNHWGEGQLRYEIEGMEEFLDTPGEFLLRRDGRLTYIPLPGQTLANTEFIAPDGPKTFEQSGFIRFRGKLDELKKTEQPATDSPLYVRNISFERIDFSCEPFTLPPSGLCSGQAATNSPTAITAEAATGIVFRLCRLTHLAGYVFWFDRACHHCRVEQCFMEDMGAGGVRIGSPLGGTDIADNVFTHHISVIDNIIRTYGQIDASAVGVWIGKSADNEILHNDISDSFYTGISAGWVWGYAKSLSVRNKIEFNHIHHIGKGVLSDMGGFYSLGTSTGTTVSNNVIHDVWSYNRYGRGGWGLYTDEGSSNMLFENNLVYRVHTGSIHQHYGRDNVFRNNILAFSKEGQIQRSRNETHCSFTLEHNIILWDTQPLLGGNWKENDGRFKLRENLYCFMGKPETDDERAGKFFLEQTLSEWQKKGNDPGSLEADPGMIDPIHNDFRFVGNKANTAVTAIGFKPFDFTKAGITPETAKQWGTLYSHFEYASVRLAPDAPPAPPMIIDDHFDTPRIFVIPEAIAGAKMPEQNWKLNVHSLKDDGTLGDSLVTKTEIPFGSNPWRDFRWLGFCANGAQTGTVDLDRFAIQELIPQGSEKKPFSQKEDFESLEKLPFPHVRMSGENRTDAFELTQEGTNRFLRLKDSPEYKAAFNPHFWFNLSGIDHGVRVSFDVRLSDRAVLYTEARNAVNAQGQYQSGPTVHFAEGNISIRGGQIGHYKPGQWFRVVMEFPVGTARVKAPYEIVREKTDTGENAFLRLNDSPLFQRGFDPHFAYAPGYTDGIATFQCKLRVSPDAVVILEGRDKSQPYRIGSSLYIAKGKLSVAGKSICDFVPDKWYALTIQCPLGESQNPNWSLTVESVEQDHSLKTIAKVTELAPIHSQWTHRLDWFGIIPGGTQPATIDLDDIVLKNDSAKGRP